MLYDAGRCFVGCQARRAARENSAPEADAGLKLRVNEQITAPLVRLVFADGGHQATLCACQTRMRTSLRLLAMPSR